MNLFNSASLGGSIYQSRSPFSGPRALLGPAEKAQIPLQKLSNQIIADQKNNEQPEDFPEIAQIRKDSYIPKNSSNKNPFDDIPDGLLEITMGVLNMYSSEYVSYGRALSDFKEQLQGMDNTIQSYQDILDGKVPLQEGQNMQDVHFSCELAKVQRQQFFDHGMIYFDKAQSNKVPHFDESNHDRVYEKLIGSLLGECRFAKKNEADWGIDPNASDIYSEIDRVLADVNGRVAETKRGIGRLFGILYERGYGEKYKSCLEPEAELEPSHITQWIASWEQEMEQLKQSAMQQIVEKPLQAPIPL